MVPVLLLPEQSKVPVTFSSLPQEVLAIILSQSPDLHTFLSAIASCRAFFNAFKDAPTSLTRSIVVHEIGDLLSQATFVALARDARPHAQSPAEMAQAMSQLLSRWADERAMLTQSHRWTLVEGISAIRLHRTIDDLASRSAAYFLSWLEKLSGRSQESPSDSELARIKRALYRFELFCRLLPPVLDEEDADPVLEAGQLIFLQQGHPWEHEQLASVHESLWRLVAPAYNDVSMRDIAWGAHGSGYAKDASDTATEWVLSRGLRFIHDIARATTYDRRYELLAAGTEKSHDAFVFLCEAFNVQRRVIQEPRPEVVDASLARPAGYFEDPNPGPETFWRWARPHLQHDDPKARLVESRYKSMRDCGYVFWDAKRLDCTGILDQRWADVKHTFKTKEEVFENRPGHMGMKFSWYHRHRAYEKGLRGYYPPGEKPEE